MARQLDRDKTRANSRRPLTDPQEIADAEELGAFIDAMIRGVGARTSKIALAAELSVSQLRAIITGTRRTRASTLTRLAVPLAELHGARADLLASILIDVAGEALAPEIGDPVIAARVERRRARRFNKKRAEAVKHDAEVKARQVQRAAHPGYNLDGSPDMGYWQHFDPWDRPAGAPKTPKHRSMKAKMPETPSQRKSGSG